MNDKPNSDLAPEASDIAPDPATPVAMVDSVDQVVKDDMVADAEERPRSTEESLPPPGTVKPGFWQQPSTTQALGATLAMLGFVIAAFIDWLYAGTLPSADAVKLIIGVFIADWGLAFGIHMKDVNSLRWK